MYVTLRDGWTIIIVSCLFSFASAFSHFSD